MQQYGHNKYIGWILRFPCSLPGVVYKLEKILKEMNHDLEDWKRSVAEARKNYYSLNYFTAQQLLLLRKELWYYKNPDYCGTLKPEVIALLQCLSRDINPDLVIIQIRKGSWDKNMISSQIINDFTSTASSSVTLSENQDIAGTSKVAKEIFKTLSFGRQPTFTESELTDNQKVILANLIESYGYHKKLILLAFERCAKPDVEEAVTDWCDEHDGEYNFFDSDDKNESEYSDNESEKEYSEDTEFEQYIEDNEDIHSVESNTLKPLETFVIVRELLPVDENHPVVKRLMLSGYSMELSKRAAEQYDNEYDALEYLESMEDHETEGLFSKSLEADQELYNEVSEIQYDQQFSGESNSKYGIFYMSNKTFYTVLR